MCPQEFVAFASDLVHSGPDTFFARVGKEAAIRTAIVPGAAHLIQKVRLVPDDAHTISRVQNPSNWA